MLGNLIGAVTKGVVLGAVVYGAKKLYDKRTYTPMKEPLVPSTTSYDSSDRHASSGSTTMNSNLQEDDLIDEDMKYQESSVLTKP